MPQAFLGMPSKIRPRPCYFCISLVPTLRSRPHPYQLILCMCAKLLYSTMPLDMLFPPPKALPQPSEPNELLLIHPSLKAQ